MTEKHERRRRLAWLLILHGLLFLASWVVALYAVFTQSFFFDSYANFTQYIAFVLLWMPVLGLHAALHLYAIRWNTPNDARKAYREGYADALKQFADRAYDERPLARDEDEQEALPVKRKRSG